MCMQTCKGLENAWVLDVQNKEDIHNSRTTEHLSELWSVYPKVCYCFFFLFFLWQNGSPVKARTMSAWRCTNDVIFRCYRSKVLLSNARSATCVSSTNQRSTSTTRRHTSERRRAPGRAKARMRASTATSATRRNNRCDTTWRRLTVWEKQESLSVIFVRGSLVRNHTSIDTLSKSMVNSELFSLPQKVTRDANSE